MKIVMISDHERSGGAAIAANRLAAGFMISGHQVIRLVAGRDPSHDPPSSWSISELGLRRPLRGAIRRMPTISRADAAARPWVQRDLRRKLVELQPDLVNIHNLHGAFRTGWSAEFLNEADRIAPTLWTLHDMWSFTGRCAYSRSCTRYLDGCNDQCPTPHEYPELTPSRVQEEWEHRRSIIGGSKRSLAVAPSRWLARIASDGLWGQRVTHVPYGLPLDDYKPRDQSESRRRLGLREDDRVLLTSAVDLSDARKGLGVLVSALEQLESPITLMTMGTGTITVDNPLVRVVGLGPVEGPEAQSVAYSAADVLVHPALADNLPLVVQESIACGTPVISFDVGGLSDLVRPGVTGWLAAQGSGSLRTTIKHALTDSVDLRASCRGVADAEWELILQASRYVTLVEGLS